MRGRVSLLSGEALRNKASARPVDQAKPSKQIASFGLGDARGCMRQSPNRELGTLAASSSLSTAAGSTVPWRDVRCLTMTNMLLSFFFFSVANVLQEFWIECEDENEAPQVPRDMSTKRSQLSFSGCVHC